MTAAKRTASGGEEEGAESGPPPASLVLHEEQLHVKTRRVIAGAARLRKRVRQETVHLEVPTLMDAAITVQRRAVDPRPGRQPEEGEFAVALVADTVRLTARARVYERVVATVETQRVQETVETDVRKERLREERDSIGGTDAEPRG